MFAMRRARRGVRVQPVSASGLPPYIIYHFPATIDASD